MDDINICDDELDEDDPYGLELLTEDELYDWRDELDEDDPIIAAINEELSRRIKAYIAYKKSRDTQ